MNEQKMIDLTKRFSKMSEGHNPAEVLGASFNMIQSICNFAPELCQPTASFMRQAADKLEGQGEGIIVEH